MEREYRGKTIEIEPNSRPYLLKRIIADGFDITVIFLLFTVLTLLLAKTPLGNAMNRHTERYLEIQNEVTAEFEGDGEAITEALKGNAEYRDELFAANLHGYLLKALACFLVEAVVLVLVPFLNRDRSTPGKLLTNIMLFHERRQSRAVWYQVIGRFVLVLIGSLAWYLFTGVFTFLVIPVIRITVMLLNKKHKTILDYMTAIMVIEKLSYDGIN